MGKKNKHDDFEIIIPANNDAKIKREVILDANNVLNRLNNLERDYKVEYDNLVSWVYNEFKSCSDPEHVDEIPLMSVLKRLPSDKLNTFFDMLEQCEATIESNNNPVPDYISFNIARYALTNVIEELHSSGVKEIIVTKEDGNLVVKYKPYWKA